VRSAEIVEGKLRLILNNCIAAVQDGQGELERYLAGHALAPKALHRVEVVFEELVGNIVRHGFAKGSGQSIHVWVAQKPGAIELIFEDDGMPFNPLEAPLPAAFSSLEDARIGGLGISLVVKLADDLRYERLPPAAGAGFAPCNRMVVRVAA
jgi:anti-sigma regulatory factor (Ser/Thr protein kinase)